MSAGTTEGSKPRGEARAACRQDPGARRGPPAEHFITGPASNTPSCLQLLCLNFRFT